MRKGEVKRLLQYKKRIMARIIDLSYELEDTKGPESVGIAGVSYAERVQSSAIGSNVEHQAITNMSKSYLIEEEKHELEMQIKKLDNGMAALTEREQQILTIKYIEGNKFSYTSKILLGNESSCKGVAKAAIDKLSEIME